MPKRYLWLGQLGVLLAVTFAAGSQPVDYVRDVKPIFSKHCVACHGVVWQRGSLRLDTADGAKLGGDSGPALVPGQADESTILLAVQGKDGHERMPKDAPPLSPHEIALLRNWIASGAIAPPESAPKSPRDHWAYRPITRPEVPKIEGGANPIDAFIRAEHANRGLKPVGQAEPATLHRRLSLDLTGIPPTPDDVAKFVAQSCPDQSLGQCPDRSMANSKHACVSRTNQKAYAGLVDRMLASPQYGERWARHWMDVWRYSDWFGYAAEIRGSAKHIWHWRDWIVESLNADLPYDRMVKLMLAADEIAPTDPNSLRATGYLARSWYRYNRNVWLDDTIEHAGKAFLGLTMNCARCHDHKYDPVSQEDYYRFRAFFEPHDVRTDTLQGELDVEKNGLTRAYDRELAPPTFLLVRGDEAHPQKDKPLPAQLPEFFGKTPPFQPVALPAKAYYPALEANARRLQRGRIEGKKHQAVALLAKAKNVEEKGKANQALRLAELELLAFDARCAADLAKVEGRTSGLVELQRKAARLEADFDLADAEQLVAQAANAVSSFASSDATPSAKTVAGTKPAKTKVKSKGELEKRLAEAKKKREAVKKRAADPGTAYAPIGPMYPNKSTGRRTALANWIASPDNPLAARVAVNQIWMRHFGTPMVPTEFDFGANGKPPTHPQLLDWLASELIAGGWQMKRIHRLIVTSQTYQLASTGDAGNAAIDPENRYYWRMNPRRLEAEVVRDAILAVAGRLDLTMGGPDIDFRQDDASQRRSLYLRHAREKQSTFLTTFDAANSTECYRRIQTVAPQQALALINGLLVDSCSRQVADALSTSTTSNGVPSDGAFTIAAYERLLNRGPTDAEFDSCLAFLNRQKRQPASDAESAARQSLVRVLFNHTDFVTVR